MVRASASVFMPGRVGGELVVAEVRLLDAGGDDEVVVREAGAAAAGPHGQHPAAVHVEVGHLGQHAVDVVVAA